MARNWAEQRDNDEKIVFQKGNWEVKEDGEKTWSLYFDGNCVDPVLDYNQYKLLPKGFMLMRLDPIPSFVLYTENKRNSVFKVSGKNVSVDMFDNFIKFTYNNQEILFDYYSLTQLHFNKDNQISLDL